MKISDADIGNAITGLMRSFDAEYAAMDEADLIGRWYFKYDPERSLTYNIWNFHDMLALYAGSCRRWEEIHNGRSSVVGRVRDKYVLPRIREFEEILRSRIVEEHNSNAEGKP